MARLSGSGWMVIYRGALSLLEDYRQLFQGYRATGGILQADLDSHGCKPLSIGLHTA